MLKKNWAMILLAVVLVAIVGVSCNTNPSDHKQQQGTTTHAPVAGVPDDNQCQSCQYSQAPQGPPGRRGMVAWPNGVTALGVLLTLYFIAWQALLTRRAVASAENSSKQELRAYLSVVIDTGSFQDRPNGVKFEGTPAVRNMGKTPAYNVRYKTNSGILREPLAENLILSHGQKTVGEYVLGMGQNYTIHIIMDDYVDQSDVPDIMSGTKGRALYYWGFLDYDDVFGDPHTTEFCHRLFFVPDQTNPTKYKVNGNYMAGRNRET